ncbi:MAG: ribosomal-processing cysteine protease Prp [Lachnospiraceae bacterium]|nr:ribosomal-processing cysteine protease Prp [Lachnospiraceae bacterium]
MIDVTFFKNSNEEFTGFRFSGHADFADRGEDVVCAGVSALVFNTVNSIEALTEDHTKLDMKDEGFIDFRLTSDISEATRILLKSLYIGVSGISEDYGTDFVKIHFKEV